MTYHSYIKQFMDINFKHFNARTMVDASRAYCDQIKSGNLMFLTIAGAMSTGELGITLSQMIKSKKVHAICCTGANIEEDIFNLIGQNSYKFIPDWRTLTPYQEKKIANDKYNRITDTCIPEKVFNILKSIILEYWIQADKSNTTFAPHEYFYNIIKSGKLKKFYNINPDQSWVVAAAEENIPLFIPGWEDSTMGNIFASKCISGEIKNSSIIKNGLLQMQDLVKWYIKIVEKQKIGFFQIGGGISGDFAISAVPLIRQDLKLNVPLWNYFCQISDSTTSYGSYSGATPNEKITWDKLDINTPKFIIESDASIIAPLMFSYILSE